MTALRRLSLLTAGAVLASAAAFAQSAPPLLGSCGAQVTTFKDVHLPQRVLADGKPLGAGAYDVRVTAEHPAPALGQSAAGECWVEFLQDGAIVGREVASVIAANDIAAVAKGPAPKPNTARVDVLKGGEHVRVWINAAGTHYLVNLSVAPLPQ